MEGDKYHPAYIEVDINLTCDGMLIVHHGEVSRFLRGKCMKETYAEIKKKMPHILTLDEFGKIKTKSPYIFDIKAIDPGSLERIVLMIQKQKHKEFAFTSPHPDALVVMHRAFPKADIFQSQPYHHGPIAALELARKYKFSGIALNKWWLTPFFYNLCKLHGKKIMVYTIDQKWWLKLAHTFFPGAYIVTNRPDLYRQLAPED